MAKESITVLLNFKMGMLMLAESQRPKNEHPWRELREAEKILLLHLLRSQINSCRVRDMLDGGMGSIEFFHPEKKNLEAL